MRLLANWPDIRAARLPCHVGLTLSSEKLGDFQMRSLGHVDAARSTWTLGGRCRKKVSRCSCRLERTLAHVRPPLPLLAPRCVHAHTSDGGGRLMPMYVCMYAREHKAHIATGILRDDESLDIHEYIGLFSGEHTTSSLRSNRSARYLPSK